MLLPWFIDVTLLLQYTCNSTHQRTLNKPCIRRHTTANPSLVAIQKRQRYMQPLSPSCFIVCCSSELSRLIVALGTLLVCAVGGRLVTAGQPRAVDGCSDARSAPTIPRSPALSPVSCSQLAPSLCQRPIGSACKMHLDPLLSRWVGGGVSGPGGFQGVSESHHHHAQHSPAQERVSSPTCSVIKVEAVGGRVWDPRRAQRGGQPLGQHAAASRPVRRQASRRAKHLSLWGGSGRVG